MTEKKCPLTGNGEIKKKWLVRYNPEISSSKDILEQVFLFQKNLTQQKQEEKTSSQCIHLLDYWVDARHPMYREENLSTLKSVCPHTFYKGPKIEKVGLFNPVQLSDKRWQTIHLTTSAIFLGSTLTQNRFQVVTGQQVLPAMTPEAVLMTCQTLGFTLFEDLFQPFQTFLTQLRDTFHYGHLIAAGGPLITLNPMEAAYFLPELNLLVRGEAELIFPALLSAIHANNLEQLFSYPGFMLQLPGWLMLSDLDYIHRPSLHHFSFNLDFLEKQHLSEGLEINVSRGCGRSCIFCSAVQGKTLRKLPESEFQHLLTSFSQQLDHFSIQSPRARTVNINDDDILQDPDYAQRVFEIIQQHQFHLWGVQTSINSFFNSRQEILYPVLDIIAQPALFMENNPMIWLGTDAFLKERGKKLGKIIPSPALFMELMEALDEREITSYHYWISSDHLSTWQEFVQEFKMIYHIYKEFPYFGLIAHAPFLVPYSTTPLYRWLTRSPQQTSQIKYKKIYQSPQKSFVLPLVERVETPYPYLNRLLNNEKLGQEYGFFDYLNQKDYLNALLTLYNFLKQERLETESAHSLNQIQHDLEEWLSHEI